MAKIKYVLFDADGVTINGEMFSTQYEKQAGLPKGTLEPFFKGIFQDCLIGKHDLKEAIKPFLKEWQWTGTPDEFLQLWFKSEHHTDKNVINLIEDLRAKDIKCYLATNQEKYRTRYLNDEMGFEDLFDHIFSSAEIGRKKPNVTFYEFIYEYLNEENTIAKDEIFYTDDAQEAIDTARKFGFNTHLYKNYDNLMKEIKSLEM